jgi:transposase
MPINVAMLIPEDDSVRLLSQIVEELDLSDLILAYSPQGRNPALPPRTMLKVLIYAYMNGVYSSRAIEGRCRRDINFMWLLEGMRPPDHNTIARFRTGRLGGQIESLFSQFVMKLHGNGEMPFENVFIDGTKIEANANKYSFVWKKTTERLDAKLPGKVRALADKINKEYATAFALADDGALAALLGEIAEYLLKAKEESGAAFVGGRGRRKTPLQRLTEETLSLLERKERYQSYMKEFVDRNSFSKTDRDATFMHMKEDHMRNSQLKPGYNLQIGVENGYVAGIDISSERSDMYALIPMLTRLENSYGDVRFDNVVTDAGYESEENYDFLERHGYAPYIKPANYEAAKKRNYRKWVGQRENMTYDAERDEYICAKGRRLKAVATTTDRGRRSRYPVELTVYQCESCAYCGYKRRCKKSKYNKRIRVSKKLVAYREASLSNITSDKGIILRVNRSIQAEGAFAMLKEDYGFRRFLTRGTNNVTTECLLMAFSYNVNKLHSRIMGRGNREILYEPQVA